MTTRLEILNLALGKMTPNRIIHDNPPRNDLETYMVSKYAVWRFTELTKRRWVFAMADDYELTLSATLTNEPADYRKYKYALPNDCLRALRTSVTEWKQRGKFLYSSAPRLKIDFVLDVPEADFDPLFIDVLASWIAIQSCMYVTESNTKKQQLKEEYVASVAEAKRINAFTIGPEDYGADDNDFSFITSRAI